MSAIAFIVGILLLLMVVRFAVVQQIMAAARDWHDRHGIIVNAMSRVRFPKPWYVRLADRWEAKRRARR